MTGRKSGTRRIRPKSLEKTPTGIAGIDELTGGGLPRGRTTLVCGSAGCGKTMFAMEFLVRGATQFNEPGVFVSFEETEGDLSSNFAPMGWNLRSLQARKKLAVDYVRVERSEIEETGEYNLEGLFIRLEHAIGQIGARRVVLDTLEALFAGLPNEAILRAELRRLFGWLKNKGVSAIVTAERGERTLTRHGLEEYVADCVILLDHRVINQISTRQLRIVKYRGSHHGTNECPFLISQSGFSVLPITSLGLAHPAPTQRVSTGVPRLDAMLGGKGYYRGSTILVSGTAGSGKTSLAGAFVEAACRRGERAVYFAFEESQDQILRNMRSIGLDLARCVKQGRLFFHAVRPSHYGLEMHLLSIYERIRHVKPQVIVMDPVTNLISVGDEIEVRSVLTRLIDFFKSHQITALFTSLTAGGSAPEQTAVAVSSLMDTWLLLRNLEHEGERNRTLYVLKSRGMAHSNQIREFVLSEKGIQLVDVYVGAGSIFTGSARQAQEVRDAADATARDQQLSCWRRAIAQKRKAVEAQIAVLRAGLGSDIEELQQSIAQQAAQSASNSRVRKDRSRKRMADAQAGS